ncbi:hypothetical protein Aduo_005759 [Ancylostoma duodenale]
MRVVFDASAHYKDKPSLNDVLHQGPLILPKIVGMIMRFRMGRIAVTSDVEKAFLQVRLHEQDRDATRCFWVRDIKRPPEGNNIVVYRFTRVTFGLKSSPFLLAATIRFHVEHDEVDRTIAEDISNNLYVDNLFMTAESPQEAFRKYKEAKEVFSRLNMNLREFMSNSTEFNRQIRREDRSDDTTPSTLGLTWDTTSDSMVLKHTIKESQNVFPRFVEERLQVGPKKLEEEDAAKWQHICEESEGFTKEIPRRIADRDATYKLEMFTDASTQAMCAAAYLSNENSQNLLIAKSRLPSVQSHHTISKLEMMAVTMGTRHALNTYLEIKSQIRISDVFILSDSEIALSWLKVPPNTKGTGVLVANIVKEMKEIIKIVRRLEEEGAKVRFGYVNTRDNPADERTRGSSAKEFANSLRWTGPPSTRQDFSTWPEESRLFQIQEEPIQVALVENEREEAWLESSRCNNLTSLRRTAAYVLRFLRNLTDRLGEPTKARIRKAIPELGREQVKGSITGLEIRDAMKVLLRMHQTQHSAVIEHVSNAKLNLRQDSHGLTRCYRRLGNSALGEDAKNPAFVAPNTPLARLIIQEAHGHLHCATAHTMSNVRQQFWIPRLRKQVKKLIRRCVSCQRFNNLPFRYPDMKDLPERRVVQGRPFLHVGLDYFRPWKLREDQGETSKAYGCIFTCTTTRLVHLELVRNNGTTAFLNAVRRFIARRGVPYSITCDNAPIFLLGEEILKETAMAFEGDEETKKFVADRAIEWRNITPYAPWQGDFKRQVQRQATSAAAPPSVVATSADLVVPALEEYSQKMQEFQKKLENLLKNQSKAEEVKTRVDKLEEEIRETKSQLLAAVSEMGKKLEEKIEVTIEAQIQQLVLVKKLCEAKETPEKDEILDLPSGRGEAGPQEADRKDSHRPHDRHHGKGDKHVQKETAADPLKDRNENLVVCPFCGVIGKHIADRCPIHRSVKDQRAIMAARINTCWFCFKEEHPTCPARVPCMYCASTNHHASVCSLPEERAKWSARYLELEKAISSGGRSVLDKPSTA